MQTPGNGFSEGWTLRDQATEYSRLQQENFNHKMRIHFLEEQLIRLNNGNTVFGSEELEVEVAQLRSALKERDQLLAEQDAAMSRATQAIDMLQEQLREAEQTQRSVLGNNGVEALRAENESVVQKSLRQVRELELELRSTKEMVESLSNELQYVQDNYRTNMDIADKSKARDLQILQQQKSDNEMLREEIAHVKRMSKGKDELVESLRATVDSLWQRKEQERRSKLLRSQGSTRRRWR
ncbi:Centrosomin, N-terminal motif 1 [Phytophthora cactorum]|nr:Centrosomin, N-terminal motif 1 [Phytophthora cactorum]